MKKTHILRLTAFCLAALAPGLLAQSLARVQSDQDAHRIFELTNQDRMQHGLPELRWDATLAVAAQSHDDRMVQERTLSHQYPGEAGLMTRAAQAGAHFQAIAENIATGPTSEAIETEWMHSTAHRTNILDPKMNALGVAVAERDGTLYAVEDFAAASQVLSLGQVEERVRELLRAQNVDPSGPSAAAEQACRMSRGMPQGTNARSMVRFQTPDLSQLPTAVAQQIRSGDYTKAGVGACSPKDQGGFTTYRVAILFY